MQNSDSGHTRATRRPRDGRRRGSVLVEFAMVCPILVAVLFAFIEFDRYLLVVHATEEATRMGGRIAILSDATDTDVETEVDRILGAFGVSKHTVTVTPPLADDIDAGDPVSVNVSVKYEDISWLPTPQFLGGKVVSVTNTLPKEK